MSINRGARADLTIIKWVFGDPGKDGHCPADGGDAFWSPSLSVPPRSVGCLAYRFEHRAVRYPSAASFLLGLPPVAGAAIAVNHAHIKPERVWPRDGLRLMHPDDTPHLEPIPVHAVGPAFPLETLQREEGRAHALIEAATRHVPRTALRSLDAISRRWLAKQDSVHLPEIDAIAARLRRPGAYFLSVNYEWGCTCRVAPASDHRSARLVRVLDWRTPGLGRHVVAARVAGAAGPFVTLTWPGYTGVLQGNAPGRFAAALNQAPMRKPLGRFYLDWAVNRARVWRMPHLTPAHLLREVFETARDFAEARRMLSERPISTPSIFSLAGVKPYETAIIERSETEARVHDGSNVTANHWQAPGWRGHPRGRDSIGRARQMHGVVPELDPRLAWLSPPILNENTRLVMIADAREGRLVAQGFEEMHAATAPLVLAA